MNIFLKLKNIFNPTHSICQQAKNHHTLYNGLVLSGPKGSKIIYKESKILPKVQIGPTCEKIVQYGPKQSKITKNCFKLSKIV